MDTYDYSNVHVINSVAIDKCLSEHSHKPHIMGDIQAMDNCGFFKNLPVVVIPAISLAATNKSSMGSTRCLRFTPLIL